MTEEYQAQELEEELEEEIIVPDPPQYYVDFKPDGNIAGFYVDQIHGDNIPETAIPISIEDWQAYSAESWKYKLDGETIREKTTEELEEEQANIPKPPPSKVELLELENADLWYELMLEKSRNDNHDNDIADLWYEIMMMMGGN